MGFRNGIGILAFLREGDLSKALRVGCAVLCDRDPRRGGHRRVLRHRRQREGEAVPVFPVAAFQCFRDLDFSDSRGQDRECAGGKGGVGMEVNRVLVDKDILIKPDAYSTGGSVVLHGEIGIEQHSRLRGGIPDPEISPVFDGLHAGRGRSGKFAHGKGIQCELVAVIGECELCAGKACILCDPDGHREGLARCYRRERGGIHMDCDRTVRLEVRSQVPIPAHREGIFCGCTDLCAVLGPVDEGVVAVGCGCHGDVRVRPRLSRPRDGGRTRSGTDCDCQVQVPPSGQNPSFLL